MELLDIQKEIREEFIVPHYLVEGIEDEIEIKNTYFEKDEETPSNIKTQPINWRGLSKMRDFVYGEEDMQITVEECRSVLDHIEDMYRILKYFEKDGVDFNRYIFIDEGEYLQVYDRFYLKHGPQIIEEAGDNMDVTYLTKRYFKEVERHWRAGELKLETELTDSDKFLAYLQ